MGATLVMVLSLAIVLGLVLVLLAELYCSLLLRRRQLNQSKANVAAASTTIAIESAPQYPSPLSSFYAQGVLQPPRSFLFPNRLEDSPAAAAVDDVERQHGKLHQFLSLQTALESAMTPPSSPPPPTTVYEISDHKPQPAPLPVTSEQLVYICNPIYENDGAAGDGEHTPFETPDTSPTRLSGLEEDDKVDITATTMTPPLTPIKQLPAKACSVTLRDARSLGTSGSDSNSTQNAAFSPSFSGSHSTCSCGQTNA
ncbi:hypothetical protein V2J09_018809 [Rumex salicifolius]